MYILFIMYKFPRDSVIHHGYLSRLQLLSNYRCDSTNFGVLNTQSTVNNVVLKLTNSWLGDITAMDMKTNTVNQLQKLERFATNISLELMN